MTDFAAFIVCVVIGISVGIGVSAILCAVGNKIRARGQGGTDNG